MQEKNTIKISLSTVFLIISIIVICIMLCFIYKLNTERISSTEKISALNNKLNLLESNKIEVKEEITETSKETNEIINNNVENTINNKTKTYSYSDIKGKYEWKNENGLGVELILSEDGTFGYYFEVGGVTGNYTIVDNTIILNKLFIHNGGVGLVVTKGEEKLTINNDNSITSNSFSDEGYSYIPSSITMSKSLNSIDNVFDIREQMKSSLGADWNNSYLVFE